MPRGAASWIAEHVASAVMQKQGLREETARHYFQQLVVALDYCHSLGIAMRDVKVPISLGASHCSG